MTTILTLDANGRIVLPDALREELHLSPGDRVQLETQGDEITLRPVRGEALLKKELGVWVYQGEATDTSITDLVDQQRATRTRELLG